MTSSDLFRQYKDDFATKLQDIRRQAGSLGQPHAKVEGELRAAQALIHGMQLEARSLPAAQAQPLLEQVARCNAELAELRTELQGGGAVADRTALGLDGPSSTAAQREKLLSATQKLQEGSRKLQEARANLHEAEAVGATILKELHDQRVKIKHAQQTLDGVNGDLDKSNGTLKTMLRRTKWFGFMS